MQDLKGDVDELTLEQEEALTRAWERVKQEDRSLKSREIRARYKSLPEQDPSQQRVRKQVTPPQPIQPPKPRAAPPKQEVKPTQAPTLEEARPEAPRPSRTKGPPPLSQGRKEPAGGLNKAPEEMGKEFISTLKDPQEIRQRTEALDKHKEILGNDPGYKYDLGTIDQTQRHLRHQEDKIVHGFDKDEFSEVKQDLEKLDPTSPEYQKLAKRHDQLALAFTNMPVLRKIDHHDHAHEVVTTIANMDLGDDFYNQFFLSLGGDFTPEKLAQFKNKYPNWKQKIRNKMEENLKWVNQSVDKLSSSYDPKNTDQLQEVKQRRNTIEGLAKQFSEANDLAHQELFSKANKKGPNLTIYEVGRLSPEHKEIATKAVGFFNNFINTEGHREGLSSTVKFGTIPSHKEQRSYHDDNGIFLSSKASVKETAHEIGHEIENNNKWLHLACLDLQNELFGNEPFTKMADVFPDKSYDDDEQGRIDKLEKLFGKVGYYFGKKYPRDRHTETLSLLSEKVNENILGLAQERPDLFKFWYIAMTDPNHFAPIKPKLAKQPKGNTKVTSLKEKYRGGV